MEKHSGLLKVPPKLEQDLADWALSIYCQRVRKEIIQEGWKIEHRTARYKSITSVIDSDAFDALRKANDYQNFSSLWKQHHMSKHHMFELRISHFDSEASDQENNLTGIYDWVSFAPALSLFIYKLDSGDFNFSLLTDQIDIGLLKGISEQEVIDILKKHSEEIENVMEKFIDFSQRGFEMYSESYTELLKKAEVECHRYIKPGYKNPQEFTIPTKVFAELGYIKPVNDIFFKDLRFQAQFLFENDAWDVRKAKELSGDDEDFKGLYTGNIYIREKVDLSLLNILPDILVDIVATTRHELQHFVQSQLRNAKGLKYHTGLPPQNSRTQKYDVHGRRIQEQKKVDQERATTPNLQQDQTAQQQTRLPHELRDIEFYTNLSDKIDEFRQIVRKFPLPLHRDLFNAYTARIEMSRFETIFTDYMNKKNYLYGAYAIRAYIPGTYDKLYAGNRYFEILKSKPGKYRKAVIEAYKSLSNFL